MTKTLTTERVAVPPREGLLRDAPFALRADGDGGDPGDGRTLDGYAAVFNRETVIDSWEGKFREQFSPGSMKKSFRENPPKIQFDHGRHPLIGSLPIARLESVREESDPVLAPDGGAHVIGRLLDTWLAEPVREGIAQRTIDGMSFRFSVVQERWYDADDKQVRDMDELVEALRRTWYEDVPDEELMLRDVREVKVPELGPVVWPAYEATSVDVRSVTIDLGRLNDAEERKTLARAVFLADAAERMAGDESPQPTDDSDSDGDGEPADAEGGDVSAGEHDDEPAEQEVEEQQDEPRSTGADGPAGEHPSREAPTEPPASPYAIGVSERATWYLPGTTSSL